MKDKSINKVFVATYKENKYYNRVLRVIAEILKETNEVAPVEVLIRLGIITIKNNEAWKRGYIPWLEGVFIWRNDSVKTVLRIIGFITHDLNMICRQKPYTQWGSNKNKILQFTKYKDRKLEMDYSKHYLWNQSVDKKNKFIISVLPE